MFGVIVSKFVRIFRVGKNGMIMEFLGGAMREEWGAVGDRFLASVAKHHPKATETVRHDNRI